MDSTASRIIRCCLTGIHGTRSIHMPINNNISPNVRYKYDADDIQAILKSRISDKLRTHGTPRVGEIKIHWIRKFILFM